MATYAIGDVQGCYQELMALLEVIHFNAEQDTLWFVGDLVNRGPDSLQVLRFIKSLPNKVVVLGNHDLHLLACAYGVNDTNVDDTLAEVLQAPDKKILIDWLRMQPLIHYDKSLQYVMCHAGIAPCWTVKKAHLLANEVENILRSDHPESLLLHMYGDQPDVWSDELVGVGRLRLIMNYLTRMRFCYADGRLNLTFKGEITNKPADLFPWFLVPNRIMIQPKIIFGHWAALGGDVNAAPDIFALDTGCVWGNCLTAMRLEDQAYFTVSC